MNFRVVLDTNILVSAVLNPCGKPATILNAVIAGDLNLIISPAMLKEARRVFSYPKIRNLLKKNKITPEETGDYIDGLSRIAVIVPGETRVDVIKDDPADNMILSCAVEGRADYIVSGDQHLASLKIHEGIEIVSAAVFLSQLKRI